MMKRNIIINMHVVDDPIWFETIILYLKSQYKMVPLEHFEEVENYEKKNSLCHITFDDGDHTFYTVAYPILKKHNIPATIFVSPESIVEHKNFWFQEIKCFDKQIFSNILSKELLIPLNSISETGIETALKCYPIKKIRNLIRIYYQETKMLSEPFLNMNIDEIMEVKSSKLITIGAHTLSHPILRNEDNETAEKEITDSIQKLSKLIGEDVFYFAYPNGTPQLDFSEREIKYLQKNNIRIAVSTEPKFISKKADKMAFPRIGITKGSLRFVKLRLLLGPIWPIIKSIKTPSEKRRRNNFIKNG